MDCFDIVILHQNFNFERVKKVLQFVEYTIGDLILALCMFTQVWSCVTKNLSLGKVYCIVDYFLKQLHTWMNTHKGNKIAIIV